MKTSRANRDPQTERHIVNHSGSFAENSTSQGKTKYDVGIMRTLHHLLRLAQVWVSFCVCFCLVCFGYFAHVVVDLARTPTARTSAPDGSRQRDGLGWATEDTKNNNDTMSPPGTLFEQSPLLRRAMHQTIAREDRPTGLTCEQATAITSQAAQMLAQAPSPIDADTFAEVTLEWLDPHGLWSAAPDALVRQPMRHYAPALLHMLTGHESEATCRQATKLGESIARWVDGLRGQFDRAFDTGRALPAPHDPFVVASQPVFESSPVTRLARDLSADLGARAAAVHQPLGPLAAGVHDAMRNRLFPELSPESWGAALLTAAVQAYVVLIDAHGSWAPANLESSVYPVKFEAKGRQLPWSSITRTAAGVRIDTGAMKPLLPGDIVLAMDGVPTAGLSVEHIEQIAILLPDDSLPARRITLWRRHEGVIELELRSPQRSTRQQPLVRWLRVGYGTGQVAVLTVPEVPNGLAQELTDAMHEVLENGKVQGIVLDLRGNRGGTTDAAKQVIGLFLPGAPLFPMRDRNNAISFEYADSPPQTHVFRGPVATLVDHTTASAAEMIAGGLAAYHRAPVIGATTYGKGCAQEYVEDNAGAGLLRISTVVFCLPDGTPLQKTGIVPDFALDFGPRTDDESRLSPVLGPWKGPDVRDHNLIRAVPWPKHGGTFGPCRDRHLCDALRALGA